MINTKGKTNLVYSVTVLVNRVYNIITDVLVLAIHLVCWSEVISVNATKHTTDVHHSAETVTTNSHESTPDSLYNAITLLVFAIPPKQVT